MTAKKKRAPTTTASASKKKKPAQPPVPMTPEPESSPTQKPQKYSALEAAARVLRESGRPTSCPELIEQMAAKGYWTSPKGKTPSSTLYAAIMREVKTKGKDARFVKTERGKFAANA